MAEETKTYRWNGFAAASFALGVVLIYLLAMLVNTPAWILPVRIPGVTFSLPLDKFALGSVLAAGLAAWGTLRLSHAGRQQGEAVDAAAWVLPALVAFAPGIVLRNSPAGTVQWFIPPVFGVLLFAIDAAESAVHDRTSRAYPAASLWLTGCAFASFGILAYALRVSGTRIYMVLLLLIPWSFFVALRTLNLRHGANPHYDWALVIAWVLVQVAIGLQYWKLTPGQYAFMISGGLYVLISVVGAILIHLPLRRAVIEPLVMSILVGFAVAAFA